MKRRLRPDELRLWSAVASSVRPFAGRSAPVVPDDPASAAKVPAAKPLSATARRSSPAQQKALGALHYIEPNRERRISIGREEIGGRLDLHGMDQAQAHAALTGFVTRAYDEGHRAVLVITGRGRMGGGVLRLRTPDWLADGSLRRMVAGVSRAHQRHGGDGALYVALKRKP